MYVVSEDPRQSINQRHLVLFCSAGAVALQMSLLRLTVNFLSTIIQYRPSSCLRVSCVSCVSL